jgi:DNA-binding SARP family transcriptional activator
VGSEFWQIELLGGFRIRLGARDITGVQATAVGNLIAYLACHPDREFPRGKLADDLWPDIQDPQRAPGRLRDALHLTRQALDTEPAAHPLLFADRHSVWLNTAGVAVDVVQFRARLEEARRAPTERIQACLSEALDLYRGELLPGYL